MEKICERLRYLRHEKELTLKQVSLATSFSVTALHQWETGKAEANAPAIIVLAKFFDVTTDYLLGVED